MLSSRIESDNDKVSDIADIVDWFPLIIELRNMILNHDVIQNTKSKTDKVLGTWYMILYEQMFEWESQHAYPKRFYHSIT